jgi:hypothetical protein
MVLALAGTVLISPVSYARHAASFDMPACEKLMDGAAPSEAADAAPAPQVESTPVEATTSAATADKKTEPQPPKKKKFNLFAPLKLTDDKDSFKVGEDGKMKLEVQQNAEVQPPANGENADPTATASVLSKDEKLNAKLLKDSKKVNVAPIALQESEGEAEKKENTISEAERTQLSDLWTACINRSPDIQFVINKLQPGNDSGQHATATALKMIGGALFNVACVAPMMMPGANMGTYMATSGGASMIQNIMGNAAAKNGKKQAISQEQATMLYKIVRDTAEKVVLEYRKYRENRSEFNRANSDLADLKAMVATATGKADPATAIQMEYTIRKAQRDVDKIIDEAKLHKQQLVDLAGADAVARLDGQMDSEAEALEKLCGGDVTQPMKDAEEVADGKQKAPAIAIPKDKLPL